MKNKRNTRKNVRRRRAAAVRKKREMMSKACRRCGIGLRERERMWNGYMRHDDLDGYKQHALGYCLEFGIGIGDDMRMIPMFWLLSSRIDIT